jgi:hypothetical protein
MPAGLARPLAEFSRFVVVVAMLFVFPRIWGLLRLSFRAVVEQV